MLLSELLAAAGLPYPARKINVGDICYDSRRVTSESLFFCIVGSATDGHSYAAGAYRKGCRAFVAQKPLMLPDDAVIITVPDTRAALADLSAAFYGYPAKALTLIGITGTKGKTTVALMTEHILNTCGIPAGYIGTSGIRSRGVMTKSTNTTPESAELQRILRRMADEGITHCVIEVSSQALFMGRVRGLNFDTVVFTNLSADHIGTSEHPTFEHYAACKRTLFTSYGALRAVYNADDAMAEYMTGDFTGSRVCVSSSDAGADYYPTGKEPFRTADALGIRAVIHHGSESCPVTLRMPGDINIQNAMCAIAVAAGCGVGLKNACGALAGLDIPGRFEVIPGANGVTYVIDYAHNGLSLTSALTTLRQYNPSRLVCVFGAIGDRTKLRRRELGKAASELADFCIVTSDNPGSEPPEQIIAEICAAMPPDGAEYTAVADRAEAVRRAVAGALPGDIVLIAGKGDETDIVIGGRRIPYSDRACLTDAMRATV